MVFVIFLLKSETIIHDELVYQTDAQKISVILSLFSDHALLIPDSCSYC